MPIFSVVSFVNFVRYFSFKAEDDIFNSVKFSSADNLLPDIEECPKFNIHNFERYNKQSCVIIV
jgi:hypothetical protein